MSVDDAKAFVEKLKRDDAFRSRIAGAGSDEERLQLAGEAGFELTIAEYNQSVAAYGDKELSDEDLDTVAGGTFQVFVKTSKVSGPMPKSDGNY